MLGNEQFLVRLQGLQEKNQPLEEQLDDLADLISNYGGALIDTSSERSLVYRNPYQQVIAVFDEDSIRTDEAPFIDCWEDGAGSSFDFDEFISQVEGGEELGSVFIDTRCAVIADVSLLGNNDLLSEYRGLRLSGDDKKARDLLRKHGAQVRYDFNRLGDELGVTRYLDGKLTVFWPDVV